METKSPSLPGRLAEPYLPHRTASQSVLETLAQDVKAVAARAEVAASMEADIYTRANLKIQAALLRTAFEVFTDCDRHARREDRDGE